MKARLNKKITTAILAGLLTASLIPMTANACRRGGGQGQGSGCAMKGGQNGKHFGKVLGVWRNTQAVKDLGLSDDQVKKLKDADFAAREKYQTLRAEMDSLRLKMDQEFSEEKVNDDAVRELSKQVAAVKGKMIEQRTETRLIIRNLLTQEQLDKMGSRRGQGFGKRNGMNKNCMMNGQGRGNGQGGGNGMGMKRGQGRM
jgi:Spy/CpxP family protein refolding chaperone